MKIYEFINFIIFLYSYLFELITKNKLLLLINIFFNRKSYYNTFLYIRIDSHDQLK